MPRISLSNEEVEATKGRILESALQIIIDEGFRNLSMRKIARRLSISATTIYNYYASVDDLYFHIRMHGFDLLFRQLYEIYKSYADPSERLHAMIKGYVEFGLTYPDFYDIMCVNRKVPKYMEVIGSPIEQVARMEKEVALKPFTLVIESFNDIYAGDSTVGADDIGYRTIQIWCDLNGILSLYNSRLLREVEEDVDALVERLVKDVADRYGSRQGALKSEKK